MEIIAIVFEEDRPFSVVTADSSIYDVEFYKANEKLYYHCSGNYGIRDNAVHLEAGRECDYWLAEGYKPSYAPGSGEGNRLSIIDPRWLLGLESWGEESDTVYCKSCDDYIPTDNVAGDPCDHIHWNDETGWWDGDGYDG